MENIYHRFIHLPFKMNKPIEFETSSDRLVNFMGQQVITAELENWLINYNLTVSNVIEGFYTPPNGGEIPVHTDTFSKPHENDACKLNFTWGELSSTTRWWELESEKDLILVQHDTTKINDGFKEAGIVPDIFCDKCYTAEQNNLKLVYEKIIDKPSILNVGQLHSTYNPSNTDRWTLSFTLLKKQTKELLTFKEAMTLFSDLIYE